MCLARGAEDMRFRMQSSIAGVFWKGPRQGCSDLHPGRTHSPLGVEVRDVSMCSKQLFNFQNPSAPDKIRLPTPIPITNFFFFFLIFDCAVWQVRS